MKHDLHSGFIRALTQTKRKSARIALAAEVVMRRTGRHNYQVAIHDLSREGCRVEFLERPDLDERVWVKFDGLESLEATVCWADANFVGIEFTRPIHSAVFEVLVERVQQAMPNKARKA